MQNNKSTQLISLIALILLGGCNINSHWQSSIVAKSTPVNPANEILDQDTSFYCDDKVAKHPTIIARSDLGNIPVIIFKASVGKWTAPKRCHEVANRLMKFHDKKKLAYLTWERQPGGGRVINIAKHEGDLFRSAEFVELLFMLKQDDQVHEILESLEGILSSYGDSPISN